MGVLSGCDHPQRHRHEILNDEKGRTCAQFLARATEYFADHGITTIGAVIAELNAKHIFIKPHCPWQNGKVERYNRTLQAEWAYRQVFDSNDDRCAALAPWLEHYNNQRRHSAIGNQPPISRLSPT